MKPTWKRLIEQERKQMCEIDGCTASKWIEHEEKKKKMDTFAERIFFGSSQDQTTLIPIDLHANLKIVLHNSICSEEHRKIRECRIEYDHLIH